MLRSNDEDFDPSDSKALKIFHRFVPSTDELDGQKMFTIKNGKRLATPLLAVLVLVEITDVIFAIDSVPAVLAVTKEQYIAFASNAFAILGLRALYFLLAEMREKFRYLQTGLGVILVFVGFKMVLSYWHHLPIWVSLSFIAFVLTVSIVESLRRPLPSSSSAVESGDSPAQ
jgi:tellurite resistance protein TerC